MVYVSFRLRAFGWLEVPVSLAELVPGAFPPERLADAEFDPSRQKKQLPYRTEKSRRISAEVDQAFGKSSAMVSRPSLGFTPLGYFFASGFHLRRTELSELSGLFDGF